MIAAVILAAGGGTRLGARGPKQLLELDGRPLLQHAVDAVAAAGIDELVVVLGHGADAVESAITLPKTGRVVRNPAFAEGQAGSLRAGLRALPPAVDAALILLGDQPTVRPQAIRIAVTEFGRTDRPIVVTRYDDGPGHPVVLGRAVWSRVGQITGDVGARGLIRSHQDLVIEASFPGRRPLDVDTWEDYLRLARSPRQAPSPEG